MIIFSDLDEKEKYIYLDYNSTCTVRDVVKNGVLDLLKDNHFHSIGSNPSSPNLMGQKARSFIELSRNSILKKLFPDSNSFELVFTSCATESNNQIIKSFEDGDIFFLKTDHASIENICSKIKNAKFIKTDSFGFIVEEELEDAIKKSKTKKKLLSISYVNSETGLIQKIDSVITLCKQLDCKVHLDCSQAFSKIKISKSVECADFITFSGHKIGALQGVSCLLYNKNSEWKLIPQIIGGGQEFGLRSGTENILSIASLKFCIENLTNNLIEEELKKYMNYKENALKRLSKHKAKIFGYNFPAERDHSFYMENFAPNVILIGMENIKNSSQVILFDLNKIMIGTGSACSSGKIGYPSCLKHLKIDEKIAETFIRCSMGYSSSLSEISRFCDTWIDISKSNK